MFYIKWENATLTPTVMEPLWRGDDLSQKLRFLVGKSIPGIDLESSTLHLCYCQDGGIEETETLERVSEDYNASYAQYTVSAECRMAQCVGRVSLRVVIHPSDDGADIQSSACVIRIGEVAERCDDEVPEQGEYLNIYAVPGQVLDIGYRGEKKARRVVFDISAWREIYRDGTVQLIHQRPGDEDPYPCVVTIDGGWAYWVVQTADVNVAGDGYAVLSYYAADQLVKSAIWGTSIGETLGEPTEEAPEAEQAWVDKVLEAGSISSKLAEHLKENGLPGIVISEKEPEDPSHPVWLNPNGVKTEVQGDWDQNDADSLDYIKHRTHFVEPNVEQQCLAETHFTSVEVSGNDGKTYYSIQTPFLALALPPVGSSGTVTFNGTEYHGQWKTPPGVEYQVYFGNASLYPYYNGDRENTGEPFFVTVVSLERGEVMADVATQSAMEVICSATFVADKVHTLDPKFIKDMYYAEENEVSGTGFDAWRASLMGDSPVIYKVRVKDVDYSGIGPTSVGPSGADYNLGDVLLHVDVQTQKLSVSEGDVSVDDIVFYWPETVYHKIPIGFMPDELQDDLNDIRNQCNDKLDSSNPSGVGSFSMNRKSGTTVGNRSSTLGYNTTASGDFSHAEGNKTTASGDCSHAEGENTTASGDHSHAEGNNTWATGDYSHAEGNGTVASNYNSHAEGYATQATGTSSHAEGYDSHAEGYYSHTEGFGTITKHKSVHVCGEYNLVDPAKTDIYQRGTYVVIVGNGKSNAQRSNAHTLDWAGNAWFAGTIEGTGIILKSSTKGSSKRFLVTVDDTGTLSATEVTAT